MGRPYASELARLSETSAWALAFDLSALRKVIRGAQFLPLLAVGSGGSMTAAHFLAGAQRRYARSLASVATPLEAIADRLDPNISVWLLSAGGSNVDILASFAALVQREPKQLAVMCGRSDSPLVEKAKQHLYVDLIDFATPAGKDGFLATNSLLAFTALIGRAYAAEFDADPSEAVQFDAVLRAEDASSHLLSRWRKAAEALWLRDTTIVLHGPNTRVGAADLESKFTEAALGNLQIADYRNFAHGRHHWIAKHGQRTGVLAFTTSYDRVLAERTISLIPSDIPVVRIDVEGEYLAASLTSLIVALHVAGWAGAARGIDPGRPGVPEFGRRLYNLPLPKSAKLQSAKALSAADAAAIERKAGSSIGCIMRRGDLKYWREALSSFKTRLSAAAFSAVVFDYDGTLVDTRDRFAPPTSEIAAELTRLLDSGLLIGVATGRGASVRRDLQACLPRQLWKRVVVGYYNGGEVALLEDDASPDGTNSPGEDLTLLAAELRGHSELMKIAVQSDRKFQITLEPRGALPENRLWDIANQIIQQHKVLQLNVVRSSHSIDILAPGVSKHRVLERVVAASDRGTAHILKIGDRGRWPGNDFVLLREPFSLSVDELSPDPTTCWNLAPPGQRGVQVTLVYCRALRAKNRGDMHFHV